MSLLSRIAVEAARAYGMFAKKGGVSASYLVVAGGGGGGNVFYGGGGGGGGVISSTASLSTLNTYSITVGAGGTGGNNGNNSVISGTGLTTITSVAGGAGGSNGAGSSGGSGGGGSNSSSGGTGTSGQGNNGGSTSTNNGSGGGGGATAVGSNGGTNTGGAGGAGLTTSISGSSQVYGSGGGGAAASTGGASGGTNAGNGASGTGSPTSATANFGGGGGGGGATVNGGSGGSGIVIISYPSVTPLFVGGTLTTSGGNQIHTFTSSGTLSPLTPVTASYLVLAGGGGGGASTSNGGGAGGGAGGLLTSSTTLYSGATYVVTIGGGGAGSTSTAIQGTSGSNSVVSGTGLTTLTSVGGGGGGSVITSTNKNGLSGGSGGGGSSTAAVNGTGGSGTSGQGNAGGTGNSDGVFYDNGAGGGGASAVGANATSTGGGNGGAGSASSISGSSVTYAGGGGGSGFTLSGKTQGTGGSGGGGNAGSVGTINLGGGGGGSITGSGAAGGSGIVIISYAGSQQFNGGLVTSSGGNTIHTFTATGALTPLTNNLNNSLRFRSSASAYLSRTPTLAGNRKTWTYSTWIKRGLLDPANTDFDVFAAGASDGALLRFVSGGASTIRIYDFGGSFFMNLITTQVFRDPSAWYHIVLAVDSTQATSSNRVKLYVNGNQVTAFSTAVYPSLNQDCAYFNNNVIHNIGRNPFNASQYFDGYMTDINFIDGQALEPYYFGNNDANGVWKPIKYTGTYGTNGFYLTFGNTTSTTTLGYDSSPNGNNWTCNNISLTAGTTYDAMLDVPTNTSATVGNYCVMNPLQNTQTLTGGNLNVSSTSVSYSKTFTTMNVSSGKWYLEFTNLEALSSLSCTIGISSNPISSMGTGNYLGSQSYEWAFGLHVPGIANNGVVTTYGSTLTTNDILIMALDMDNGKVYWGKNGTWFGSSDPAAGTNAAFTGLSGLMSIGVNRGTITAGYNVNGCFNFGQRPFSYTPPTGYVALNTYNLPTPTILQGNKYMDASLYTGTGTTRSIINGALFQPDLVWVKVRGTTGTHVLTDSNRGANKQLFSNLTNAEATATNKITGFLSNGFTLGADDGTGTGDANYNGNTYVGWQWQAGQGSTSSNTSGSITSTVSVNTTAGFSIVTYTGTGTTGTVGHSLGVAPKMIILKLRNSADSWLVYHAGLPTPATNTIILESTAAVQTGSPNWNSTNPTSSVFSVYNPGSGGYSNKLGGTYVAYCWAEIAGFSKFGSYTGNNSTDGPFVYTGFRPKFILIKNSTNGGAGYAWFMYDTSRNTYNVMIDSLLADSSSATYSDPVMYIDTLSNGFKIRGTAIGINASSTNLIYAAFAENPFKNANAR